MSSSQTSLRSVSSSHQILSDEALSVFRARGDAAAMVGSRRVVSNTSYMSEDSVDSEATIELPEFLYSVETLEFLEFDEPTALHIWREFLRISASAVPLETELLRVAKNHVRGFENVVGEDGDWTGTMRKMGLSGGFVSRLMAPEWTDMRCSGSLKEWVFELIITRYDFLQSLDQVMRGPSRGFKAPVFRATTAPPVPPRGSSQEQPPSGVFKKSGPSTATRVDEEIPTEVEGRRVLYKGGSLSRLQSIKRNDGSLNFRAILSTPPGDFSRSTRGLYVTKQKEITHKYARWAEQIVDGKVIPVGILTIAIPTSMLASCYELVGEEWRQYVWACRRGDDTPSHLEHLDNFQWIVGPLCMQSTEVIERLDSSSQLKVAKLANRETSHQLFGSDTGNTMTLLNQHCQGNVWVEALEPALFIGV